MAQFFYQAWEIETQQYAKKVVSNSPVQVDFVIGLANSVFNLPDGQVMFLSNSNKGRTVKSILLVKKLLGLVQMMSGLVNASFSLPEGQAIKMIFFAPCTATSRHEIKVFWSAGMTLGRYTKEVAPCTDKEKHVHGQGEQICFEEKCLLVSKDPS